MHIPAKNDAAPTMSRMAARAGVLALFAAAPELVVIGVAGWILFENGRRLAQVVESRLAERRRYRDAQFGSLHRKLAELDFEVEQVDEALRRIAKQHRTERIERVALAQAVQRIAASLPAPAKPDFVGDSKGVIRPCEAVPA